MVPSGPRASVLAGALVVARSLRCPGGRRVHAGARALGCCSEPSLLWRRLVPASLMRAAARPASFVALVLPWWSFGVFLCLVCARGRARY